MEFRELKTFQAVATLMSFNRAAAVLNYAQSTVSAQIRSLEYNLGKALFYRKGKNISLTPAGSALLSYTQRLMNLEQEIHSKFKNLDNPHGLLAVKLPQSVSTYILPHLIEDFSLLFPYINFDFDWCTHYSLQEAFDSSITDLAFLITDNFQSNTLNQEILLPVRLDIICSPMHELAKEGSITIKHFLDRILILPKSDCSYSHILEKHLTDNKIKPRITYHFNSIEAIKQCIMAGTGLTIIPHFAVKQEILNRKLYPLQWQGPDFNTSLIMIWKKEQWIPDYLSAFMIAIRTYINEIKKHGLFQD